MRFAIAYSKKDPAGINIINQLKKIGFAPEIPTIELKKETIYSENLALKNIDFLIFASKHKSEKNNPSLSLHAPGNWRSADFGGKPGKVCPTSSFVLKYLFKQLNEFSKPLEDKYEITLECTHHGPLIKHPCCFIEIGSTAKQWQDTEAGKAIAKTILSLQNYKKDSNWIPSIGIGGPHYCPNFNKIQLGSDYALGHIIPEYALPLSEPMLRQAEEKTLEQVKEVVLDWKGCGKSDDRKKVVELIKKSGLKSKRTGNIEKD